MPPKYEFDQTRDAIGVDNLNDSERKAMLDKFKSAGGKVLSEKELKEQKKKENLLKQSRGGSGTAQRSRYSTSFDESANAGEEKKAKSSGAMTKFMLKIRTFMDGLTPFSSDSIRPKFFEFVGLEVKQAIVEFNLIGNDLFLQNRDVGKKIAATLDQKNPVLMELLQRLHSLFDAKDFNKLLEFHQSNPGSNVPFRTVDESIKNIYRKLYYLYPYQETIKKALAFAVDCYKREISDENNRSLMEQKRKKFLKDLDIVFVKAFPKFFSLISRMDVVEYIPFSPALEKAINVNQDDKIGKRKKGENSTLAVNFHEIGNDKGEEFEEESEDLDSEAGDLEESKTDIEDENEKVSSNILSTKEYQYGLKLMRQNPIPALRKKHDAHNRFLNMSNNDRAFLAFLFFLEFDRELSFVLTTKKIKLAPDYSTGTKKDYKQIMADIFNQSRNVIQTFDNYMEVRSNFKSLEKQAPGANYIEASKRKEQARNKMDMEGRNVRGLIRTYMDNVTRILATLITDMKTNKAIVENMDEALTFDSELEGSKRLNGQAVKQCILEAYCYSLALNERLLNGDLFGGILEMTDEEMINSFGSAFKENPA